MKKTVLIALVSVLVIAGLAIGIPALTAGKGPSNPTVAAADPGLAGTAGSTSATAADLSYEDGTYTIDGTPVTLVNGVAEAEAAPGSASKVVTRSFGKDASGDLNADGQADVAFVLTQDGGGSGTFYYVVAALKTGTGFEGTNAVLLGDRVAPQSISIKNGVVTVRYLDRKPDEPMSAQPTVSVSKQLKVVDGQLTEASAS